MDKINQEFPFPEFRNCQYKAIESTIDIFNTDKKFIMLEVPTGGGKSAIALTIARLLGPAYILTVTKQLQTQYIKDFGEHGQYVGNRCPMIDLKGRNAYPCIYYNHALNNKFEDMKFTDKEIERYKEIIIHNPGCDIGECIKNGKSRLDCCADPCKYWIQKDKAINSHICLMNFSSFLFQTLMTKDFSNRNLLIIDEAHTIEKQLMGFIELTISDKEFLNAGIGGEIYIKFPEFKNVIDYVKYFTDTNIIKILTNRKNMAKFVDDWETVNRLESIIVKLAIFLNSDHDNWVFEYKERSKWRTITFKPILVNDFADKYLFSKADKVLMMSATILEPKVMADYLGIDKNEIYSRRFDNDFPKENRPIYIDSIGNINYQNKYQMFPKMINKVDEICDKYENERGIIHTHTFEIAETLIDKCKSKDRFFFQKDERWKNNKDIMLEEFKKSKNGIIVAPCMHEGLDLPDECARFAIITKIPYPSQGDPQIKKRLELSDDFYTLETAIKIVQSAGRIVRHKEDWGHTYIIDGNFYFFNKKNGNLFPKWFKDAIIFVKNK